MLITGEYDKAASRKDKTNICLLCMSSLCYIMILFGKVSFLHFGSHIIGIIVVKILLLQTAEEMELSFGQRNS